MNLRSGRSGLKAAKQGAQQRAHTVHRVPPARPCVRMQTSQKTHTSTTISTSPPTNGGLQANTQGAEPKVFDLQERMEFLKQDLQHLFDEQGLSYSAYDDVVEFKDPITKYNSIRGYMFNIGFLRRVFNPKFELHDIKPAGPYAVVTRWTMTMDFTVAKWLPTSSIWQPQLIFTGTSTYGFNPDNGKINKHIDTWDSIQNQRFFSIEAFVDFLKQMMATYSTPDLETPEYIVLRRTSDYQVRQYPPYLVAETPLATARDGVTITDFNPAGGGFGAFGTLARYIFGGNEKSEKMEMTTPVFTSTAGNMQFVIGPSAHKDVSTLPAPLANAPVTTRQEPGGIYAVRVYGGIADERNTKEEADKLIASLQRDGILYQQGVPWKLARYNDPGTLPPFRRNEVMVQLQEPFELWQPGEVDAAARAAGAK